MSSVSNAQYRASQRADGGPFARLEPLDRLGMPTSAEDAASVDVYFSDRVEDGRDDSGEGWMRILSISPNALRIYLIHQRSSRTDYGDPVFDNLRELWLAPKVSGLYSLPRTIDDVDEIIEGLPVGFYKNWRYGLGVRWEYKSILKAIDEVPGVQIVYFHSSSQEPGDDLVREPCYALCLHTFQGLRRQIDKIAARHQRAARNEKVALCHNELLTRLHPRDFPRRSVRLAPDALSEMAAISGDDLTLSKRDRRAAIGLVRNNAKTLVKEEPQTLLRLKQEIELVALEDLIRRCAELLDESVAELRWQRFLAANPFVLTMAFHYPVVVIAEQPYVGGKIHTGVGGSYGDFLMAAAATKNLAIVEIKRPGAKLLGSDYRGAYPPSSEMAGAVAQVIAQRVTMQGSFISTHRELDR